MTNPWTVFDLKNEVMHLAAGQPPARSTYQPVQLPGAGERKTVRVVCPQTVMPDSRASIQPDVRRFLEVAMPGKRTHAHHIIGDFDA